MSFSRRRTLCALAALGAAPLAFAQSKPHRVGLLTLDSADGSAARFDALKRALRELGYAEGRTVAYELHAAGGDAARLTALAAALATDAPALVVSDSSIATLALRKAAPTLPIVAAACDDPVASRFAKSLEQPGGNVTGLTAFLRDETPKLSEIVARFVPRGARVAGLFNPGNATYRKHRAGFHFGTLKAGIEPVYLDAVDAPQIDEAFAAAAKEKAAAIVVMNDPLFVVERARIVKLASASGKPVLHPTREFVQAGGLVSFGPNLEANFKRAASYVDRILKGAKPAELPIQAPERYEIALNRKAARAQKIAIPADLAKRAALTVG